MIFRRWWYYLTSIPTLLMNIQERLWLIGAFLGLSVKSPYLIHLTNNYQFRVRGRMDVWVIKETVLDRDYERFGVPLQDGWIVIDIGAGLGDFSVHAAKRCPNGRIFAFEPAPESFSLLQENILLNQATQVKAIRNAVASKSGLLTLTEEDGVPVMYRTESLPDARGQRVRATTLKELFEMERIDVCDFMKLDCEGAEYDILLNAPPDILQRIRHISMEYHENVKGYTHTDLVSHLQKNGFRVQTNRNPAHGHIGFLHAVRA